MCIKYKLRGSVPLRYNDHLERRAPTLVAATNVYKNTVILGSHVYMGNEAGEVTGEVR